MGVGGIYGCLAEGECGCKEVYRFPHITIPTLLVYICSFFQQHPYFLFFKKKVFVLVPVLFCNYILCIK